MKDMGNPVASTARTRSLLSRQMQLLHAAINQSDEIRSVFLLTNHHTVMKNFEIGNDPQKVMSTDDTSMNQRKMPLVSQPLDSTSLRTANEEAIK